MRSISLTIPLPSPLLTDNVTRRLHWAKKGKLAREQREIAGWFAKKSNESIAPLSGRVRMDIEVFPRPKMGRLDDDNFWSAMKATFDGLADAGIVENDKQFVIGSLVWGKERTGELVITLTEMD